ncbi:MAG: PAS domain-containing protein [Firmicutes bacterium]|nr:PAS domain-containing protein [Bacillota bacterium]
MHMIFCAVLGQEIEVVAIYNGHVSGRTVGSTRSIYGDDVSADDFDFSKLSQDSSNQLVTLSNGKVIKSSSYYLRGVDFTYILGINYDITLMKQIRNYAEDISQTESDFLGSLQVKKENSLAALYEDALSVINKPVRVFRKADRQTLIRLLNEKNFFGLDSTSPRCASLTAMLCCTDRYSRRRFRYLPTNISCMAAFIGTQNALAFCMGRQWREPLPACSFFCLGFPCLT